MGYIVKKLNRVFFGGRGDPHMGRGWGRRFPKWTSLNRTMCGHIVTPSSVDRQTDRHIRLKTLLRLPALTSKQTLMTSTLRFKAIVDPVTCMFYHLRAIDSSDSPLSATPADLLASHHGCLALSPTNFYQAQMLVATEIFTNAFIGFDTKKCANSPGHNMLRNAVHSLLCDE